MIATRVNGGIVERLAAAERVIDEAAKSTNFGVIGQGKGVSQL